MLYLYSWADILRVFWSFKLWLNLEPDQLGVCKTGFAVVLSFHASSTMDNTDLECSGKLYTPHPMKSDIHGRRQLPFPLRYSYSIRVSIKLRVNIISTQNKFCQVKLRLIIKRTNSNAPDTALTRCAPRQPQPVDLTQLNKKLFIAKKIVCRQRRHLRSSKC